MPTILEVESPLPKPHLRFIYFHHGLDKHEDKIISALSDRNILLLEAVGDTLERRQDSERRYNLALAHAETLSPEELILQEELIIRLRESKITVNQLLTKMIGSGIKILFIDIDSSHPQFPLFTKSVQLMGLFIDKMKLGQLAETENLHREYVATRAQFHAVREIEVKSQIEKILTDLQRQGISVKAAVLQGIIHQPTTNLLNPEQYQIEVLNFDDGLGLEPHLWLEKRMGGEPSAQDYRRGLLSGYILVEAYELKPGYNPEVSQELSALVGRLTDQQVDAVFHLFEILYRQNLARLVNRRRLTPAERENYAPFAFSATITELLDTIKRWLI